MLKEFKNVLVMMATSGLQKSASAFLGQISCGLGVLLEGPQDEPPLHDSDDEGLRDGAAGAPREIDLAGASSDDDALARPPLRRSGSDPRREELEIEEPDLAPFNGSECADVDSARSASAGSAPSDGDDAPPPPPPRPGGFSVARRESRRTRSDDGRATSSDASRSQSPARLPLPRAGSPSLTLPPRALRTPSPSANYDASVETPYVGAEVTPPPSPGRVPAALEAATTRRLRRPEPIRAAPPSGVDVFFCGPSPDLLEDALVEAPLSPLSPPGGDGRHDVSLSLVGRARGPGGPPRGTGASRSALVRSKRGAAAAAPPPLAYDSAVLAGGDGAPRSRLHAWLLGRGLGAYYDALSALGAKRVGDLALLTPEDLDALAIPLEDRSHFRIELR